ncbi:MAG: oxepin-CoA hydrolase / 3-oxo-5,6-dehydrosuberyl-CoA semialdehyde dehydrogenase [Bacteroidetes bacterium]|jgi:hypothetical protein|nr:oxepin-CoA hydrolase / 3-oxo-5,6-dehydrosuberyl-CoA semialdehyde dehydrogenase [Bacteroidota bacterium]
MVDITNVAELKATLNKLNEYAEPVWGKMTPQHAIEHLTTTLPIATGKREMKQVTTPEEALAFKARLIGTMEPFARGIKSVMMGDEPPAYLHPNLQSAKDELLKEVEEFNALVSKNPTGNAVHPRMGQLSWEEWTRFFNKHFTHHFTQFDIIK